MIAKRKQKHHRAEPEVPILLDAVHKYRNKLDAAKVHNESNRNSKGYEIWITLSPNCKAILLIQNNTAYNVFVEPDSHELLVRVLHNGEIIALSYAYFNTSTSHKGKRLFIFNCHGHLVGSLGNLSVNNILD